MTTLARWIAALAMAAASLATVQTPLRVVFLGDSYTDPNGAPTWADLLSAENGWTETNLAYGGTGYLRTHTPPPVWGKCDTVGVECPSFAQLVDEVAAQNPNLVFILGGRNELGQETSTAWQDGVQAFLAALHAAVPTAMVYVLSPLWDDDPVPAGLQQVRYVVQSAAALPSTCYVDLQDPLLGHPEYVLADGIHPNAAGQAAIKDAVAVGMARPLEGFGCGTVVVPGPVPTRTRGVR